MTKRFRIIAAGISVTLLIIGGIFGFIMLRNRSPEPIPKAILQQLDFEPRTVVTTSPELKITTQLESYKYDKSIKVLSFSVLAFDTKVVISEQPYPDILVFDKLVNAFEVYSELDTKLGKVYLGRPKDNGGGQAAVGHTESLLIFGKPDKDLTDDQWRQIFDSLQTANK